MAKFEIEEIKILIADSNRQLRSSLKGVLHHHGFRRVLDAFDIESFEDSIRGHNPDLILCDVDLKGGGVCNMIHALRHNKVGLNPFAAVILFIEEANEEIVRQATEAGLDDLQVKPVVTQKVIDRVNYLIKRRKPFVVTTDYVGPDRRKAARDGSQEIPLFDVPNTLALKASGAYNPQKIQQEISKAVWEVNAQKIERHVFQVGYLVERIVPAFREGQINRESLGMVSRLVKVSGDIVHRLEESDFKHIAALADTLQTVAKSLWVSGTQPKDKDLNLLAELSTALNATFKLAGNDDKAVRQIQSTIHKKYKN